MKIEQNPLHSLQVSNLKRNKIEQNKTSKYETFYTVKEKYTR